MVPINDAGELLLDDYENLFNKRTKFVLLDPQVPRGGLTGRQHEIVVRRAADAQLHLRPVKILTGRIEKFDAHG